MIRTCFSALRHPMQALDRLAERKVAEDPLMQRLDAESEAAGRSTRRIERQRRKRIRSMPEAIADAIADARRERDNT